MNDREMSVSERQKLKKYLFLLSAMLLVLGLLYLYKKHIDYEDFGWRRDQPLSIVLSAEQKTVLVGESVEIWFLIQRASSCKSEQIPEDKLIVKDERPWRLEGLFLMSWPVAGQHEIKISCEPLKHESDRGSRSDSLVFNVVEEAPENKAVSGGPEYRQKGLLTEPSIRLTVPTYEVPVGKHVKIHYALKHVYDCQSPQMQVTEWGNANPGVWTNFNLMSWSEPGHYPIEVECKTFRKDVEFIRKVATVVVVEDKTKSNDVELESFTERSSLERTANKTILMLALEALKAKFEADCMRKEDGTLMDSETCRSTLLEHERMLLGLEGIAEYREQIEAFRSSAFSNDKADLN